MLKLFFKIIVFLLLLGTIPSSAFASNNILKNHTIKFYLDPNLVPDLDFAKIVLPKYVQDMNFVLAKNTNRRLIFNPDTDIIFTSVKPHTDGAFPPLPEEGFEIWAYAVLGSYYGWSYGGYMGLDISGSGVLAGLKWSKIYDPDSLVSDFDIRDYWIQINNMLHELAHVFNAGIGEYYKLANINDSTEIKPLLNIRFMNFEKDSFWNNKQDYYSDPLLRLTYNYPNRATRETLLSYTQFSKLTATIITNNYRNNLPEIDLEHVFINIKSSNGETISNANIKIWKIETNSSNNSILLFDDFTNINGEFIFAWSAQYSDPHNPYGLLRLIKVYKEGYIPLAKYVSIFDADEVKIIEGKDIYNIDIVLNKLNYYYFPNILTP